uniref:Uncharacterized protein n=1 Tax=Panagrolaimus sp. PS1159 TaxID=55785 RepID=A0AC35G1X6_9BILA
MHLANSNLNTKAFRDVKIQPHWLVIEGEEPAAFEEQQNFVSSFHELELNLKKRKEPLEFFEEAWKAKPKLEACLVRTKVIHPLSAEEQQLFKEIMEIMVADGDINKKNQAMKILRNDPTIQSLLSRIISFVGNSMKANIAQECLCLLTKILFKIFKKHDLPYAQHRTLNILSKNFQHSKTSPATLVAVIFCFKLFGPEVVEIYLFQHLKKIKDLIGNYKPPEQFIDSPRKHDTTKLGDAIFEALFEYIKSPLMEERTLEYCKQIFGPFGEDIFKRIKSDAKYN